MVWGAQSVSVVVSKQEALLVNQVFANTDGGA